MAAAGVRGQPEQADHTAYITPAQRDALSRLHERTRVPKAEHFREAVDDLLAKYDDVLKQTSAARAGMPGCKGTPARPDHDPHA